MEHADLYDAASKFFQGLERARLKNLITEHLKESDRALQFEPADGEPFYAEVKQGEVKIGKGKKYEPDLNGGVIY
jgi:hypothetical protein